MSKLTPPVRIVRRGRAEESLMGDVAGRKLSVKTAERRLMAPGAQSKQSPERCAERCFSSNVLLAELLVVAGSR
jgi:hypothetical protein